MMKPLDHLMTVAKEFPNLGKLINQFIGESTLHKQWPSWCFMPMDAWYGIISEEYRTSNLTAEQMEEAAYLAAIGTWRYTQGIYTFKESLYEELINGSADAYIDVEKFYQLPEWSVYIETPGLTWNEKPLYGFWCHLQWNGAKKFNELRLLLHTAQLIPIVLPLDGWTFNKIIKCDQLNSKEITVKAHRLQNDRLHTLCFLAYCLCDENLQIFNEQGKAPLNPTPKFYKGSFKLFPPQILTLWSIEDLYGTFNPLNTSLGSKFFTRSI